VLIVSLVFHVSFNNILVFWILLSTELSQFIHYTIDTKIFPIPLYCKCFPSEHLIQKNLLSQEFIYFPVYSRVYFISIYPVDTDPVLHSQINVISKIQSARSLSTTSLKLNQKKKRL